MYADPTEAETFEAPATAAAVPKLAEATAAEAREEAEAETWLGAALIVALASLRIDEAEALAAVKAARMFCRICSVVISEVHYSYLQWRLPEDRRAAYQP